MTAPVLLTVGYEGRTADEVVELLLAAGVTVLVDVRLTPLSRKPGLSGRRLSERLPTVGIRYLHLPGLGNPKDNRDAFHANDTAAVDRYRGLLDTPPGAAGVEEVARLAQHETPTLLCLERDWLRCHRRLVVERLGELHPGLTVRHL